VLSLALGLLKLVEGFLLVWEVELAERLGIAR
jgi:hypothetical protein